jgi:hypothetical protein
LSHLQHVAEFAGIRGGFLSAAPQSPKSGDFGYHLAEVLLAARPIGSPALAPERAQEETEQAARSASEHRPLVTIHSLQACREGGTRAVPFQDRDHDMTMDCHIMVLKITERVDLTALAGLDTSVRAAGL